ncbi:MAG TPA: cytochrome c-type biogenesis CcmF C-terminal domain-containing protein, partial [Candidatus Acidoferrales bacterium]
VVHFAMVLIFIGISGAAFNQDTQMEMSPGATMQVGNYTLVAQSFTQVPGRNYTAERATMEVLRDGKPLLFMYPERRFYPASEVTGTMVAIHSTLKEDLYVVYAGRSPEDNLPVIHAYVNPLVKWIWLGAVVMVLGTGLALLPNVQAALAMQPAPQPDAAAGGLAPVKPAVRTYEGHD